MFHVNEINKSEINQNMFKSVENVSLTLGSKTEPFPLSTSLTQQTSKDEILPPDRPISFFIPGH